MSFKQLAAGGQHLPRWLGWTFREPTLPVVLLVIVAAGMFWGVDQLRDENAFAALMGVACGLATWLIYGKLPLWIRGLVLFVVAEAGIRVFGSMEYAILANCAISSAALALIQMGILGIRLDRLGKEPTGRPRQFSIRLLFSLMVVVALLGGFLNRHRFHLGIDMDELVQYLVLSTVSLSNSAVMLGGLSKRVWILLGILAPTFVAFVLSVFIPHSDFHGAAVFLNASGLAVFIPTLIIRLYGYRVKRRPWWGSGDPSQLTSLPEEVAPTSESVHQTESH